MNTQPAPTDERPGVQTRGCLHPLALALFAALLLFGIVVGAIVGRFSGWLRDDTTTIRPTRSVVVAVRDLARLESAEYHIERVMDLKEKQSRFMGLIEAEDGILLVASGSVTAGVDLSKMAAEDFKIDETKHSVSIKLPAPTILSSRLDNERTYVHTRRTDLLARRQEGLESRARQEAEKSIVEAAKESGILSRARKNSEQTIKSLVRSLGYERVEVSFAD
jgi:hypothetical protein